MATTYTYSLSTDFGDNLEPSQLQEEIAASAIVTDVSRIDTVGDVVDIIFVSALSGGDQTILNGLVSAHVPVPQSSTSSETAYIYSSGNLNIFNESSVFDVPLNTEVVLTPNITHTSDSEEVKFLISGTYSISYKLTCQSTNNLSSGRAWLSLKPGLGSYSQITGSEGHYFSTDPDQITITGSIIASITANDTIKLQTQGLGAGDSFILIPNDTNIQILQLT